MAFEKNSLWPKDLFIKPSVQSKFRDLLHQQAQVLEKETDGHITSRVRFEPSSFTFTNIGLCSFQYRFVLYIPSMTYSRELFNLHRGLDEWPAVIISVETPDGLLVKSLEHAHEVIRSLFHAESTRKLMQRLLELTKGKV